MTTLAAAREQRFHTIDGSTESDSRSVFRRDRDRLLYCSAFRRLSGITQVVTPSGSHPTHNRLTHSLEVAQIGRSIAETLLLQHEASAFDAVGGLDPDVVEAACLAHDLGHPPFGHVSESELNRLLDSTTSSAQGFEGNAQSFRIINRLATRYVEFEGLNLTRATLSAMSKYPWRRAASGDHHRKWGTYDSEGDIFDWSREHLPAAYRSAQTIEAEIMDYADDVAYAVHDLEDFYRVGMVPLERIRNMKSEQQRALDALLVRKPTLDKHLHGRALSRLCTTYFPPRSYEGTRQGKALLRSLTSSLVGRYVSGVEFDPASGTLVIPLEHRAEVELLKSLTWVFVIESRALLSTRYGYASMMRSLFENLMEATRPEGNGARRSLGIFPDFFRERMIDGAFDNDIVARAVADTIASLTEAQAIGLYQRLTGSSLGAVLDPIL